MRAGSLLGWNVDVACPEGVEYVPHEEVVKECSSLAAVSNSQVRIVHDALEAAKDSDVLYTGTFLVFFFCLFVYMIFEKVHVVK